MSLDAGLVCPSCAGRFRPGFTRCATCKTDLVDVATYEAALIARDAPQKALEGKKVVAVVTSSLTSCREVERILLDAGVPCYLSTETGEDEALQTGAMKVGVMVAEDDLGRVSEVMKRGFTDMVAKEGRGVFRTEAIDVAAAEVTCPACGFAGPLKAGECADCGLFLGAPE